MCSSQQKINCKEMNKLLGSSNKIPNFFPRSQPCRWRGDSNLNSKRPPPFPSEVLQETHDLFILTDSVIFHILFCFLIGIQLESQKLSKVLNISGATPRVAVDLLKALSEDLQSNQKT